MNPFSSDHGQSLIEIIVAIALFSLSLASGFMLFGYQLSQTTVVEQTTRAWASTQEGLEAARSIRDRDWNMLTPGTYGLNFSQGIWNFQATSDTNGGLVRSLSITDRAANEREVVVNTTWNAAGVRPRTTTARTILTNWRSIGAARLSGNWGNPQTLGSIDLGPGNQSTGLTIRSNLVYLTANASDNNKHDLYIVNVQNPTSPSISGSLHTGPGLSAVAVYGNYAYVANQDDDSQLQIIDISNVASPTLVTSVHLPSEDNNGSAIATSGTLIYVGLSHESEPDGGPEFFIVDASNPNSPVIRGSLEIGSDVNDISVFNNRVFLSTSKNSQEFIVIDATNPSSPVQTAFVDIVGTGNGRGLYINDQDQRAYLGRSTGSVSSDPELVILNVSQPDSPTLIGSLNFGSQINAVFAADTLAFLGTDNSSQEFQIFNVSNPSSLSYYSGLNFPQVATDMTFASNTIYVAVRSNDALRIITSQ